MSTNMTGGLSVDSRVKMKYWDRYATGKITIIRRNEVTGIHEAKVLFDGEYDLPYDYYSLIELEKE